MTAGRPGATGRQGTTTRSSGSGFPASVRGVVVDTSFFRGNYPPQVSVESLGAEGIRPLTSAAATHVRLDVIPDGGLARLRINGEIIPRALADLRQRWLDALPRPQRQAVEAGGPAAR